MHTSLVVPQYYSGIATCAFGREYSSIIHRTWKETGTPRRLGSQNHCAAAAPCILVPVTGTLPTLLPNVRVRLWHWHVWCSSLKEYYTDATFFWMCPMCDLYPGPCEVYWSFLYRIVCETGSALKLLRDESKIGQLVRARDCCSLSSRSDSAQKTENSNSWCPWVLFVDTANR